MKKIRLVIVDDDPSFIRRAQEYLSGTQEIEVVGCANDGFDAGRLIIREQPEAVVLDFVLRRINSLSLLRSIRAMSLQPSLIVCSAFLSDASIGIARNLGVDFFVGKPVCFPHLHECIVDMVTVKRRMEEEARSVEMLNAPAFATAEVHRTLISSGISPRLSGFSFLAEGMHLLLTDQDLLKNMSQRLYPRIAQTMNTTPNNVERNIRSAIRGAARKSGAESQLPTNRQFISVLFRKILEKQRAALT